ncbi:molybdopterin-binding protein [Taibaiella soli]|uniref:Molybdopterin-binding protein n=1 Tax=Taibaiella soli TaxID=1649169 RepID=A0A2W2B3F7_9BACT|nr:molybdopterin-binding protein [Taibaiella soli]PZF74538.1 molybdopterin-binding protein [Taibaiella soli]
MKKVLILLSFVLLQDAAIAQKKLTPTTSFTISGNVKTEATITLNALDTFKQVNIGDVSIKNHLGESKYTHEKLKGVLLKDVLKQVVYTSESPKVLSEFYFTCVATDGYKVVFSWNELYNNPLGDHVYVITEENGKKANAVDDRIAIISTTDVNTGRRYVKCLSKIIVNRIP